jgi:AcrR family transcriptional regulator
MRLTTEQKVLDATRELLAADGVQGLTVEGVAARSGVAKTTIYRKYRSKYELALAVVLRMVREVVAAPEPDAPDPDAPDRDAPPPGPIRTELIAFVDRSVTVLGSTLMGRVMQGLVSDLGSDPQLARAFQEQVVSARLAEVRRLLEIGVKRGEVRPGIDYELAHELLFGPVYYRLLLSGRPLEPGLGERIVDAVMPWLSGESAPSAST